MDRDLTLTLEKFNRFLMKKEPIVDGIAYRFMFPNDYGASVISHSGSYGGRLGLWEVAVLKDNEICYTTPITPDVLGFLEDSEVKDVLTDIFNLK